MFSNLGNIFINKPRQAETTNTRLGIGRHDAEQERRKNKKKQDDNPVSFEEGDNTIVSTSALRVFLANFLKSVAAEEKEQKAQQVDMTIAEPEAERPPPQYEHIKKSGKATHAIHAYETTAQKTRPSVQTGNADEIAASLGLESHEIRTIHQLLDELKRLEDRNIEYLRIERSDSFLNSLVAAVEKVKHSEH